MPELNFNALIPRGPQSVVEGFNLGQEQANQLLQQQQARQLNDVQLRNAMRGEQEALAESEAAKGSTSLQDLATRQRQAGLAKQALATEAAISKQRADQLTQAKTQVELIKHTANQIFANPQNAAQILTNIGQRAGIDVNDDLAQIQQLGGDPEKIKQWAAGHVLEADKMLPKFQEFSTPGGGKQIGTVNPLTGGFTATTTMAPQMTPGEKAVDARSRERLAAETATGVLTPQSLDVAANVYLQTGQLPQGMGKSASALRTQVMNRATELSTGKPAADVAGDIVGAKLDVASRGKAVKDFSTGIQGRQVNAFNTAIDHLGTMYKAAEALNNGDIKAFNSLGNVIARQTGQPAPTNFDAAKQIVTAEVIKAVVASGGGVTERQEAERNFAAANSPDQLKGIINTYKQLLGGQLKSLSLQYENTTGRKDFDQKLTGDAKAVVKELRGGEQKAAPAAAANVVTLPDGRSMSFPNAKAAADFKKAAGL